MALAVVYFGGAPGSGKSTIAHFMAQLIESRLGLRVTRVDFDRSGRRKLTVAEAFRICLREPILVAQLSSLFRHTRRSFSRPTVFRSLNRAILTAREMLLLQSMQHLPDDEVVLVDEAIWHRLWSRLFPVDCLPRRAALQDAISRLLPRRADSIIIVDVVVPRSVCKRRIMGRLDGGRFSSSSPAAWLAQFESDALYDELRRTVRNAWAGRTVVLQDAGDAVGAAMAERAFQAFCAMPTIAAWRRGAGA